MRLSAALVAFGPLAVPSVVYTLRVAARYWLTLKCVQLALHGGKDVEVIAQSRSRFEVRIREPQHDQLSEAEGSGHPEAARSSATQAPRPLLARLVDHLLPH